MSWGVEYTNEFGAWWTGITDSEQEDVAAVVELLMEHGPELPFPIHRVWRDLGMVTCANFACRAAAGRYGSSTHSTPGVRRFC